MCKIPPEVIKLAKEESEKSNVKKAQLGSVVFTKNGKILSSACNLSGGNTGKKRYMPKYRRRYWSHHAEVRAIKNVHPIEKHLLNGACIYTYRKNGLLAAPCKDCWNVIIKSGITEIYYSMGEDKNEDLEYYKL